MNWDASLIEQAFSSLITAYELPSMFEPIQTVQLLSCFKGGQDEPN